MKNCLYGLGLLALVGCGSGGGGSSGGAGAGACASVPFLGTYHENAGANDEFVFRSNCTGSNTNCSYTYTHNAPLTAGVDTLHLTVTTATGGGGCPTAGQTVNCTWSIPSASQLILNCNGGGNIQYSKL